MNINLIIFLIIVACVLSFILGVYVANMNSRNTYFYCKNKMMKQAIKIQEQRIQQRELELSKLSKKLDDIETIEISGKDVKSFEDFLKSIGKPIGSESNDDTKNKNNQ